MTSLYHWSDTGVYKKIFLLISCLLAFSLSFPMVLNNILVILIGAVWICGGNFKRKIDYLRSRRPFWLFCSLFFILVLGLITTENFKDAGSRIERSIPLIVLPLVYFTSDTFTKQQSQYILISFFAGCLLAMLVCIGVAFYKNSLISYGFEPNIFTIELTFPIGISHVYFGMYLSFGVIAAVYLHFSKQHIFPLFPVTIVILLMLSFMLTITSKIAFISLIVVTILIGTFTLDLKRYWLQITAGMVLVLILLITLYNNIGHIQRRFKEGFTYSFTHIENNKKNYSSTRMGPLKCTLEIIEDNWLFGVGTGDNGDAIEACYVDKGLDQLTGLNSHNEYLDYLMTFGIAGLILLLACLLLPLRWAFLKQDYLYASFLLLFILCNLTENMLLRNKGIVFYAFFNSIFATQLLYSKLTNEKVT